uniref:Core-binding (CB) domain-containing protein n=1 Tax=Parastrongyloides trichosuri TaxID=131310 RepID=A0A0N5A0X2_PARTI
MNNQSNQPSTKKNCNSSPRVPISPAASAWYTTPAWNATGSTRYQQQDNNVEIEADTVTSTPGADRSTQVERSRMGHKRPRAAAVLSSRNSLRSPQAHNIPFSSPTHSPLGSSRFSTPFDMSSDEDITPPIDSSAIRHPRTRHVSISDHNRRLFNSKTNDTADKSGRVLEMKKTSKFNHKNFRRFLLPEEIDSSDIASLSTKRKLRHIGIDTKARDPIFSKYEIYLKRNHAYERLLDDVVDLTRKDKYSLNLMKKMYFCLTDRTFTTPLAFLSSTEKTISLLLTSIGHVTNTCTIKNYRRSLFEFLTFLRIHFMSISDDDFTATSQALDHYKDNIVTETKRAIIKNMQRHRQNKVTIEYNPYPYYSLPLKKLDFSIPKPLTPLTFSKYSLKVGLYVILMNGIRPEMVYKISRENVHKAFNPEDKKYWGLFKYFGKSKNLEETHVIDFDTYETIFKPYLLARAAIIEKHFPEHPTLKIETGPLFFDSKGTRFSNNINELAKPIFKKELDIDMEKLKISLCVWRKSAADVIGYLQFKGVESTAVEDNTELLRNYSSQISKKNYNQRVNITDAMKRWNRLRHAESIYVSEDLVRYNTVENHEDMENIEEVWKT